MTPSSISLVILVSVRDAFEPGRIVFDEQSNSLFPLSYVRMVYTRIQTNAVVYRTSNLVADIERPSFFLSELTVKFL